MNLKNRLTSAMIAAAAALSMAGLGAPISAYADSGCQFVLGFQTLDNSISTIVGACVDNQAFATNGDALQHTTNGLMVWRKADNFTAFTNGDQTWVNGPCGVQQRSNAQRFQWETGGQGCGLATSAPASGDNGTIPGMVNNVPPSLTSQADGTTLVNGRGYSLTLPAGWKTYTSASPQLVANVWRGHLVDPFYRAELTVIVMPGQWSPSVSTPFDEIHPGSQATLNARTPKGQPSLQLEAPAPGFTAIPTENYSVAIQGPNSWAALFGYIATGDQAALQEVNSILDSAYVQ